MSTPEPVLALRPFLPARDYDLSARFHEALGFVATHRDGDVTIMKLNSFSFILQNFYDEEAAGNCMVQLLVRDVDAWWAASDPAQLVARFGVKPPKPPAMRNWGLKVGFVFDPSGVLWHVAEAPFCRSGAARDAAATRAAAPGDHSSRSGPGSRCRASQSGQGASRPALSPDAAGQSR